MFMAEETAAAPEVSLMEYGEGSPRSPTSHPGPRKRRRGPRTRTSRGSAVIGRTRLRATRAMTAISAILKFVIKKTDHYYKDQ